MSTKPHLYAAASLAAMLAGYTVGVAVMETERQLAHSATDDNDEDDDDLDRPF